MSPTASPTGRRASDRPLVDRVQAWLPLLTMAGTLLGVRVILPSERLERVEREQVDGRVRDSLSIEDRDAQRRANTARYTVFGRLACDAVAAYGTTPSAMAERAAALRAAGIPCDALRRGEEWAMPPRPTVAGRSVAVVWSPSAPAAIPSFGIGAVVFSPAFPPRN